MKTAKQILYKIRDVALEHEISMRIFLLLKKTGVPRKLNYWMTCAEDRSLREHPSDDMLRSQKFYRENSERVKHINDLLADEMSKNTWGGYLPIAPRGHL